MDSTKLEQYRQQLQRLSSQIRTTVSAVTEQARAATSGQGTGELSQVPLHLADMGTEEYLHDLNTTLLENEEYLANEIGEALRRIENGSFGLCENCGKKISAERLRAIPHTRFCVRCTATADNSVRANLNVGRPRGPKDTMAPEGEMNEDTHDVLEVATSIDQEIADRDYAADIHAAGTAGGGTAIGGLAGSNIGHGDPSVADLQDASASSDFDVTDLRDEGQIPRSGVTGGAVGGTPAGKRAR